MPPPASAFQTDEQVIEFLVLCLENSGKTNFEEVAKQSTHDLTAAAAYKKLWNMKRKYRAQREPTNGTTPTPKSPTKIRKPRSSPRTKKVISYKIEEE